MNFQEISQQETDELIAKEELERKAKALAEKGAQARDLARLEALSRIPVAGAAYPGPSRRASSLESLRRAYSTLSLSLSLSLSHSLTLTQSLAREHPFCRCCTQTIPVSPSLSESRCLHSEPLRPPRRGPALHARTRPSGPPRWCSAARRARAALVEQPWLE